MRVELVAAESTQVQRIWRGLEDKARVPYFLSWGWIENWLACVPPRDHPNLAVMIDRGAVVAACFVARRATLRHHVFPCRTVFVNTTGVARFDELTIEHNRLLRVPGGPSLLELIAFMPHDWDEVVVPAVDASELAPGAKIDVVREVASPFVDLAKVRAAGDYVSLLGAATRSQIRRARRAAGEVTVERAGDVPHAIAIYDELVALHTAAWQARGEPGAFADPWFDQFHRRLIAKRFAAGEIELLRIATARGTLGCLYNFRYRDEIAFYQSGFRYDDDPRAKPGYVCHAAAIEDAALAGCAIYDLLGGDARYKRCLATDETKLVWLRARRPRWRFQVEQWLRAVTATGRSAGRSAPADPAPR